MLIIGLRACPAQAVEGTDPTLLAPREFLALFDIDQQKLSVFESGTSLDEDQRERMLAILFRLRQYSPAAVDHFAADPPAVAEIAEHPAESRGQLFTLAGHVTRVVREPLDASLAERFDFDHYYRCTFETDAHQQAVVCALAIPAAWKLDAPIDERAGAQGLFLKLLPGSAEPSDQQPGDNQPAESRRARLRSRCCSLPSAWPGIPTVR